MGRVSPASDNTAIESFCALSQKNIRDRRNGTTRSELTDAIAFRIGLRIAGAGSALGRLTSVEFKLAPAERIRQPAEDHEPVSTEVAAGPGRNEAAPVAVAGGCSVPAWGWRHLRSISHSCRVRLRSISWSEAGGGSAGIRPALVELNRPRSHARQLLTALSDG